MTNLFEFNEDFEVVVNPQVVTLLPFKKVLDKYPDKKLGISELSFIVFLLSPKSDFADIRDEREREKVILSSIVNGSKIIVDSTTREAIDFYKERNHTPTTIYLDRSLDALDKLGAYFKDVDFTERDVKGNLVYDPKKVVDTIKESPKVMSAIRDLKDQIKKEQELESGIRGSGQKGVYED